MVELSEPVVLVLAPSEALSEEADCHQVVEIDHPRVSFGEASMEVTFFQNRQEILFTVFDGIEKCRAIRCYVALVTLEDLNSSVTSQRVKDLI